MVFAAPGRADDPLGNDGSQNHFGSGRRTHSPESRFQLDYKLIVILAVDLLAPDKAHSDFMLLLNRGDPLLRVI